MENIISLGNLVAVTLVEDVIGSFVSGRPSKLRVVDSNSLPTFIKVVSLVGCRERVSQINGLILFLCRVPV